MNSTKKITLATVKAFIRDSALRGLHIKTTSRFDGQCDGVRSIVDPTYCEVQAVNMADSHRLGIDGAWFVGDSRDYFTFINNGEWTGFNISNCCGSFILAVPAKSQAASKLRVKLAA